MWRQVGRFFGVIGALSIASVTHAQAQTAPAAPAAPAATATTSFAVPAQPPLAATTTPAECFPHCRSGYSCHQGQCISLCNPPCDASESCTSVGECAPAASAAAPTMTPIAPVAAVPVAPMRSSAASCSAEPSALRPPGKFVFAAHVGVQIYGQGNSEQTVCQGDECVTQGTDFDDKSLIMLGFDGMFHASSGLRLGLGYWLVPRSAIGVQPNKANTRHLGSEHELDAIVEGIAPLKPSLSLALRAQGGPRLLVAGGDLADSAESFLAACSDMPVDHCEGDKGPHFGAQFTAMVGLIFGDKVRGRVDLAAERYFMGNGKRSITDGNQSSSSTTDMFGTRVWLLGGLEL